MPLHGVRLGELSKHHHMDEDIVIVGLLGWASIITYHPYGKTVSKKNEELIRCDHDERLTQAT